MWRLSCNTNGNIANGSCLVVNTPEKVLELRPATIYCRLRRCLARTQPLASLASHFDPHVVRSPINHIEMRWLFNDGITPEFMPLAILIIARPARAARAIIFTFLFRLRVCARARGFFSIEEHDPRKRKMRVLSLTPEQRARSLPLLSVRCILFARILFSTNVPDVRFQRAIFFGLSSSQAAGFCPRFRKGIFVPRRPTKLFTREKRIILRE